MDMEDLKRKIETREAVAGVVGVGCVGLQLSMAMARAGFSVIGFDVDVEKVRGLQAGKSHVGDVPEREVAGFVKESVLQATADFDLLERCDTVSICVPTPLDKTRDPDISHVVAAAEEVARRLHPGMLVILESTTYPGTTKEVVLPLLEKTGLRAGSDFCLAFSPERVDPGQSRYTVKNTPKVIGGVTPACTEMAAAFYAKFIDRVVPVSSSKAAETVKLLENTFRAVNIGLVNELAVISKKLELDVWEVIDAAATKPFGFMPFYPGPGLGGHCLPVDPIYLSWSLKSLDLSARFIELASEINASMPRHVVGLVADALNELQKTLNGSHLLILGVTYKRGVADLRESPALDIMARLIEKKANVSYQDPYVPELRVAGVELRSLPFPGARLEDFDCAVICTDHPCFDYQEIVSRSRLVVDTRNATRGVDRGREKVRCL